MACLLAACVPPPASSVTPARTITAGPERAPAAAPVAAAALRPPERLEYQPPLVYPAGALDTVVPAPPARVWDHALSAIRAAGFEIEYLDEREGTIVAVRRGEAANFVDCGTITAVDVASNRRRHIDAAAETAEVGRNTYKLERQLRLDARLTLSLQPSGGQTHVQSNAMYVVTKEVSQIEGQGARGRRADLAAFRSGERGSFDAGTVCQPTGTLERLPLGSPTA